MATLLKQNWWVLLLRGLAAALFGLLALVWPGLTAAMLVFLFGAYALADGGLTIVGSLAYRKGSEDWWLLLLAGLASIATGILAFLQPSITELALLYLIAAWALVSGMLGIVAAFHLRKEKETEGEWSLLLGGLLSLLFGLFAFASPGAGALSPIWLIGSYAIILGVLLVIFSFRVRSWAERLQQVEMKQASS